MSEEQAQIVFIKKHPELEPILDEMGPILSAEEVLQIDEHAILFAGVTGPLTRTCEKGDRMYAELKKDDAFVEKVYRF
ncbi:hypothetical protein KY338_06475 [Candidatus Woesearchaeota archaeon]|nr:hypothetical protein [Candidatus Woesearchaeota archaeon]MBW3006468.1 hypothetical protein [Candidatus Woesearchaeota archaeon]